MAVKFISHREIAFRGLLGMLRTPPVAVMNYYSNLFLNARFVLGEDPRKLRKMDMETRRVECLVGVEHSPDNDKIQRAIRKITDLIRIYEEDKEEIESKWREGVSREEQKLIQEAHREVADKISDLEEQEYRLLLKLTPLMNLKMIETYMDNNMDLKSFFKENGRIVTQMELGAELDKIKTWVYQQAVEMMPNIRFTKLE